MQVFVVTLVTIGLAIILLVGGGLSWLMEDRRKSDMRRRSAREAAARFRRRFGVDADRAVAKILESKNISRRKRRFYNLISSELHAHAPRLTVRSRVPGQINTTPDGTQT